MDGMGQEGGQEDAGADSFIRQPEFEVAPNSPAAPPRMGQRDAGGTTAGEPVTMEALERLFDRKLGAVQEEIASLKMHALSKKHVGEALGPITKDVEEVKGEVRKIEEDRGGTRSCKGYSSGGKGFGRRSQG